MTVAVEVIERPASGVITVTEVEETEVRLASRTMLVSIGTVIAAGMLGGPDVRFRGQSGHQLAFAQCPLMTQNVHLLVC